MTYRLKPITAINFKEGTVAIELALFQEDLDFGPVNKERSYSTSKLISYNDYNDFSGWDWPLGKKTRIDKWASNNGNYTYHPKPQNIPYPLIKTEYFISDEQMEKSKAFVVVKTQFTDMQSRYSQEIPIFEAIRLGTFDNAGTYKSLYGDEQQRIEQYVTNNRCDLLSVETFQGTLSVIDTDSLKHEYIDLIFKNRSKSMTQLPQPVRAWVLCTFEKC